MYFYPRLFFSYGVLFCAAALTANNQAPLPATTAQAGQFAAASAEGNRFEVGAIVLDNLVAMQRSDFADILAAYAGRSLTSNDLASLSNRLAERARNHGYIFATVTIARQPLTAGVLRITVEEGAIDAVRVLGADHPAIRTRLAALADGQPVTLKRLERHVLLAGDVAGARVRRPRYAVEDGRRVLTVDAAHDAFGGRAELSNDGPRPIGPLRARIALDANALLSPFDALEVSYAVTPATPSESQRIAARYGLLLGGQGTELALAGSYSAIQPGAYLEEREIEGKATRLSAGLRHPLRRSRKLSVWLEGEAQWTQLRQDRSDILNRRERVAVLRSGVHTRARAGGGFLSARVTLSQGLAILGATRLGDPLAYRSDAAPDFTSLAASVQWRRALPAHLSIVMAAQGLVASGPLPLTEDFGLGGTRFVRGYNFNERSGDKGAAGLLELRYDWPGTIGPLRAFQLYGYGDGGVVGNYRDGRGSGSLASAGGGLRTELGDILDLDIMLAVPLTGDRDDSGDMAPRLLLRMGHSL